MSFIITDDPCRFARVQTAHNASDPMKYFIPLQVHVLMLINSCPGNVQTVLFWACFIFMSLKAKSLHLSGSTMSDAVSHVIFIMLRGSCLFHLQVRVETAHNGYEQFLNCFEYTWYIFKLQVLAIWTLRKPQIVNKDGGNWFRSKRNIYMVSQNCWPIWTS